MSFPISIASFGKMPTGEEVEVYTLANTSGFSAQVIPYGAIITSLMAPDREGNLADIVLGFNDLEGYLSRHRFFGAVVGRVAGRISGARFKLDGREYDLPMNEAPNHLHGGKIGFNQRLWTAEPLDRMDGSASLRLDYHSPEGEEGYPGAVDTTVTYTVTADNSLIMEVEATTNRPTPFSLTQHSFFNLAGEGSGTIEDHTLQILSDAYAPIDERLTLLGRREPVAGKGNDFNHPRRLREALPELPQLNGDLYFLQGTKASCPRLAARVTEPASGRVLTVSTTEDCVQLFTAPNLKTSLIGKSGRAYGPHGGLCLECEGYPDGANTPELGDIILRPGRPLHQTTIYSFSTN